MSRKLKFSLFAAGVLAVGGITAWIYFTPHRTMARIQIALERSDTNSLARVIDFNALRASFKQQVTAVVTNKMAQDAKGKPVNPVASALAGGVIKHLVEQHITPNGLSKLMSGGEADGTSQQPAKDDLKQGIGSASSGYRSASIFVVVLTGQKGEVTELVLGRMGMEWKLTDIILPLNQ